MSKKVFVQIVGVYLALTTYSSTAGDTKTLSPVKSPVISKTTSTMQQEKNNLKITTPVDTPALKTQPLIPTSVIQKLPVKEKNKSRKNKLSGQSSLTYESLKNETKERIPKSSPQWSDQRAHDSGETLLNPQISNKQFQKNIKGYQPSINQPVSVKPDTKNYKISPGPGEIRFGDGKTGSGLPTTKNTQIPAYRTTNRSSTINPARGFNSQQNSTPQADVKSTGKLVTTGFVRKPVATVTSNTSGKQFNTKPRLITANRLIVKAHLTNRRIKSQPLIVKGL